MSSISDNKTIDDNIEYENENNDLTNFPKDNYEKFENIEEEEEMKTLPNITKNIETNEIFDP